MFKYFCLWFAYLFVVQAFAGTFLNSEDVNFSSSDEKDPEEVLNDYHNKPKRLFHNYQSNNGLLYIRKAHNDCLKSFKDENLGLWNDECLFECTLGKARIYDSETGTFDIKKAIEYLAMAHPNFKEKQLTVAKMLFSNCNEKYKDLQSACIKPLAVYECFYDAWQAIIGSREPKLDESFSYHQKKWHKASNFHNSQNAQMGHHRKYYPSHFY